MKVECQDGAIYDALLNRQKKGQRSKQNGKK